MIFWLCKIVGWSWILLGLWWLLRPRAFGQRIAGLLRPSKLRLLRIVGVLFGAALLALARRIGGIWGWVLLGIGLWSILKGLVVVRERFASRLLEWWLQQPVWLYRLGAVTTIGFGILLERMAAQV